MIKRLTRWLSRSTYEQELDAELAFHIEERTADLQRQGLAPAEAAAQARREFGPTELAKDYCRDHDGVQWFDEVHRNLRFAMRRFTRRRGLFASIVLTLGLCIAANAMIFAVVDAVLWQPLPYPEGEQLVLLETVHGENSEERRDYVNGRTWFAVRDGASSLIATVTAPGVSRVNFVSRGGGADLGTAAASLVDRQRVERRFFEVFGQPLARGRSFTEIEDGPGGAAVAVISWALWQREFAGDEEAVGQAIDLAGEPHTVVGVAHEDFVSRAGASVWTPLRASTSGEGGGTNYQILARPAAGVSEQAVRTELLAVGAELGRQLGVEEFGVEATSLQQYEGGWLRSELLLLAAAVATVLLIGCVNVASLLVTTAGERRAELATRTALGGGAASVFRQLLTESLFLACCGGLLGFGAAALGLRWVQSVASTSLGLWHDFSVDPRVLAIATMTTLVATALFGVGPALLTSRRAGAVSERGYSKASSRGGRLLVVVQVALGTALLLVAALLIRSLVFLGGGDFGVRTQGLQTAAASLNDARFDTAASVARYFSGGAERLAAVEGVQGAGASLSLPFERGLNSAFRVLGEEQIRVSSVSYVTPNALDLLGVPLRHGRRLTERDVAEAPRVALVNQSFVDSYLSDPAEDASPAAGAQALGRRLDLWRGPDADEGWFEIVGVVGNVRQRSGFNAVAPLQENVPTIYMPVEQVDDGLVRMAHTWFRPSWIISTAGTGATVSAAARDELLAFDPLTSVEPPRSLLAIRDETLAVERLQAILLSALAGLAVVLAAVGVAGVTASGVARRRKELGIRIALGATTRAAVVRAVVPSLGLVLLGVVCGLLLAQLGSRWVGSMLYGISSSDPASYALTAVGLLGVACLACLAPAWEVVRLPVASTLLDEG